MSKRFDHKAFLATVNGKPGVYRMIDRNGKVIYVGKAKNLKKRLASYFRATGLTTRILSLVNLGCNSRWRRTTPRSSSHDSGTSLVLAYSLRTK